MLEMQDQQPSILESIKQNILDMGLSVSDLRVEGAYVYVTPGAVWSLEGQYRLARLLQQRSFKLIVEEPKVITN